MDGRLYALTKTKTDLDGLQDPAGGSRSIDKDQTYIDGAVIAPGTLPADSLLSHSLTTDYLDTDEVQAALVTKEQVETVLTGEIDTHNHSGLLPKPANMPTPTDRQVVSYNATNDDFELTDFSAGFQVSFTESQQLEDFESGGNVFTRGIDDTWVLVTDQFRSGSYSLKANVSNHYTPSYATFTFAVDNTESSFSFYYKLSNYLSFTLTVYLDDVSVFVKADTDVTTWTNVTIPITTIGQHTVKFRGSGYDNNQDYACIDDLLLATPSYTYYTQDITEHSGIPDLTGNAGKATVVNGTEDGFTFVDLPVDAAVTKAEVEAVLTGEITSHTHAAVHELPIGGTTGQILEKTDATDYSVGWVDKPTGETLATGWFPELTQEIGTGTQFEKSAIGLSGLQQLTFTLGKTSKIKINLSLYLFSTKIVDTYLTISADGGTTWFVADPYSNAFAAPYNAERPNDLVCTKFREINSNWNSSGEIKLSCTLPAGTFIVDVYHRTADAITYGAYGNLLEIWVEKPYIMDQDATESAIYAMAQSGGYTGTAAEFKTGLSTAALGNATAIQSIPVSIPETLGKDGYVLAFNETTGTFYLKLDDEGGGGTDSPYLVKTIKPLAAPAYLLTVGLYSQANPPAAAFQFLPADYQSKTSTIALAI